MNKLKLFFKKAKQIYCNLPFEIHPAFFVLVVFCFVFGGIDRLIQISVLALLHELGHAIVAQRLGYKLKKIRLLPFGAQLSGEDMFLPNHEWKIALAGPLVNVFICVLAVATMWILPSWYRWCQSIFEGSLWLALFNMLPFFPLDGGRFFVGIVSKRVGRKKVLRLSRVASLCFGLLLIVLFVLSVFVRFNITFGIMGIAIIGGSLFLGKNLSYERLGSKTFKQKKLQTGLAIKDVVISKNATVFAALSQIESRSFARFFVVDDDMKPIGCFLETEVEDFAQNFGILKKMCELGEKNIDNRPLI